MRFVIIMGLVLVASAINDDIVTEHGMLYAVIAVVGLLADIVDCSWNWRK
jgi:hypothetical protein